MSPRFQFLLTTVFALGCVSAPYASEAAEPTPVVGLSAVLMSKSDGDRMSLIAKCGWDIKTGGEFCSERVGPEPGYVTAGPGQRLAVRLSDGADQVRADIVKREDGETTEQYPGGITATVVPKTNHRRWRVELPAELEDANAVLVDASYRRPVREDGDKIRSAYFLSKFHRPG